MSDSRHFLRARDGAAMRSSRHHQRPLGDILVAMGQLTPSDLTRARRLKAQCGASLGQVLISEGFVTEDQVLAAQSLQYGVMRVSPGGEGADATQAGLLPCDFCRRHGLLPWGELAGVPVIATSRPEDFDAAIALSPLAGREVMMALAGEAELQRHLSRRHRAFFRDVAETAVPADESCRSLHLTGALVPAAGGLAVAGVIALLATVPNLFFALLVAWAGITLFAGLALKIAAWIATLPVAWSAALPGFLRARQPQVAPFASHRATAPPRISLLVPLFRERDIATALIARMMRLDYPRALTEVLFVLEEDDDQTRDVLDAVPLPANFRVIEVPDGRIKTKPRALNYAMQFCRGEVVGIYDAEDAPEPGQLHEVATRFATGPPELACLQGRLDYYNPHANWLSRCFTIEYATWFRVILPGMARMGFAIPLGGTTVFFRRAVLESLGGWDAHNVTEDADLGMRLARHGYRTELIDGTTFEEANNRLWPWVRQRSRWLKGYMLTYLVHMRRPRRLLRQLGAWRFFGFQLFFLTAISQFLLAPVLWSFWLVPFGLPHPLAVFMGREALLALGAAFLFATAADLSIGIAACGRTAHGGLRRWVPTLPLYFPLGAMAAYKGLWEILSRPFYWDKTAHGLSQPAAASAAAPDVPLPVSRPGTLSGVAAVRSARFVSSRASGG